MKKIRDGYTNLEFLSCSKAIEKGELYKSQLQSWELKAFEAKLWKKRAKKLYKSHPTDAMKRLVSPFLNC